MGQLNRGLPGDAGRPAAEPGRQTATVLQGRSHRPPLEAPHMGQLNRPLEPADQPGGDELAAPGHPAKADPDPQAEHVESAQAQSSAMSAPWADGQDERGAPSGLLSQPSARLESPAADRPVDADEDAPSGLPHRSDQP